MGLALAAAASLAITAPASAESPTQGDSEKAPAAQVQNEPQHLQLCRQDNPAIDYRACVNATTRNRDAKIRQA